MKENDPIPRIERFDNPQKKSPCSNFLKQFLPQISMESTAQLRSPSKRRKIEMKVTMKRKSENVNKRMKRRTLMFRRARGILHALGCYGVLFREEVPGLFPWNWAEPSRLQSSARVDVHEPLPARLVGEAIVEAFAGLNRLPDPDELAKPSPRPPFHAQRRQAIGDA